MIQTYVCHKEVKAFEIGRIEGNEIFNKDGNFSVIVSEHYIDRHNLHTSGYFVEYEDGYQSWSPKTVFESGYSLAPHTQTELPL